MWKWFIFLVVGLATVACAHGGGVVFPSPTLSLLDRSRLAASEQSAVESPTPFPASVATAGEAVIEPNPADLDIRSVPTQHHAVDFISKRSAVITASPGGSPIVVHNDGELLGRNGCSEVQLAPEGDTRLTVILPRSGIETRSRFYLVGCSPGPATLTISSEGELLNIYQFTVLPP